MLHEWIRTWFHWVEVWGYTGVFILMAMESSIIPVPSEIILPPAAFWAAQGRMSFAGVVLAGTAGSYFGSILSYLISRAVGRPLIVKYGRYFLISPEKLELAQDWAIRYGNVGIFTARLLPVVRHLISIPAGLLQMPVGRFSLATITGAGVWCWVLSWFGQAVIGDHPELLHSPTDMVLVIKAQLHWFLGAVFAFIVFYTVLTLFKKKLTPRQPARHSALSMGFIALLLTTTVTTTGALTACSTPLKQAQKLMESEAFEEAANAYSEILKKQPNNEEALIGLKVARDKIIDKKLIQVRMSRLAGNFQNGFDLLLSVIQQEAEWQIAPRGGVAFTQAEEQQFARSLLKSKIEADTQRGLALLSSYQLKKYQPIFASEGAVLHQQLTQQVKAKGQAHCKKLLTTSNPEKPYYFDFLKKFCGHWEIDVTPLLQAPKPKSGDLFREAQVTVHLQNLPGAYVGSFQESFQNSLRGSAWFDPNGKKATEVSLVGTFTQNKTQELIPQLHSYRVWVPYTSYETVKKTRDVPYTHYPKNCSSGDCQMLPYTEYRNEEYTEIVAVTRKREEYKTQPYIAKKSIQNLNLSVQATYKLGGKQDSLSLNEKSENSCVSHDWNMPDIGLFPVKPNLPDADAWLKSQISTTANLFSKKISADWDDLYCRAPTGGSSPAALGDQVHRCARNHPKDPPELIQNWYRENFSVTFQQANEVLNLTSP